MKLSFLPTTLCACLFACGDTDSGAGDLDQGPKTQAAIQANDADPNRGSSETKPNAEAALGRAAPDFELKDLTGKLHKLSRHKGKTIVLEWFNPDCPFVVNAHEEGPLKEMVARHQAEDVVWIAVNSGASGKQGTDPRKNVSSTQEWGMRYPLLFDPTGDVGERYGAKTTPHMFVIDRDFVLRYDGALDNAPMGKADGEYTNFVEGAIKAIAEGQACPQGAKPYGCGIKYAD